MNIFISYAHTDHAWLDKLMRPIEQAVQNADPDAKIFTDQELLPGVPWDEKLQSEIRDADLLILLGSASFVTSPYIIGTELPLILQKSKEGRIFPILLTTVDVDYLPELKALQWTPSEGLASFGDRQSLYDDHVLAIVNKLGSRIHALKGKAVGPGPGRSAVAPGSKEHFSEEQLLALSSLSEAPYLRINFLGTGHLQYQVEMEGKGRREKAFMFADRNFRFRTDPPQPSEVAEKIFEDLSFRQILDHIRGEAEKVGQPIRLQVVLHRSASHLDRVDWESLLVKGLQLGASASYVFSRQFTFPLADAGELQIKTRDLIDSWLVEVEGEPHADNREIEWISAVPLGERAESQFVGRWTWTVKRHGDLSDLRAALESAEVVYLRLPIGIEEARGDRRAVDSLRLPIPDENGKLKEQGIEDLLDELKKLGSEQPTVVILAPRVSGDNATNRELASALAFAGVPAVIAPIGEVSAEDWDEVLGALLEDLRSHGVIDLAVTAARLRARSRGFRIVLYLRSKSARLWYDPHFVSRRGDRREASEVWAKISEVFARSEREPECTVLIGPNLDKTLSLSRQAMANEMARTYGFALSKKDRDDLGKVAEYIFASQAIDEKDPRPHVTAFLETAKDYLLKKIATPQEKQRLRMKSLREISDQLAIPRLAGSGSPFRILAGFRAKCYLTVYYHEVLEMALGQARRRPIQRSFRRSEKTLAEEHEALMGEAAGERTAMPEPTVESPLVYHCFGSFREPENLLVSETDYLQFLLEYSRAHDNITTMVRGFMSNSMMFMLGFRPNSQEFKVMLAAYRLNAGRWKSQQMLHVAVQVDPEDDHTIDPEGAKSFCQGILSDFGDQVHIYWGSPQQFLVDLKKNCPSAFWSER